MLLKLDNVTYDYASGSDFVLGPVSLRLDTGSVTALVGSNGSGKTTLIRVLLNELTGYGGTYCVDDAPVKEITGSFLNRYGIGYAPEHPVLEERLSGMETMQLLREIHGTDSDTFKATIDECRSAFHLEEWFETAPCREYSQGMRKKVSLMIALAGNPRFIVVDEPTNGLDPLAVFGLKKILSRRCDEGRGALVSSHMLDFTERISRDVVILKHGRAVFAGTVQELFYAHPGKRLDEIYYDLFMDTAEEAGK